MGGAGRRNQMTKEEWAEAESRMSTPLGSVDMKIDGYDVSLRVVRAGNLKYCIAVYVNGYIKGEWVTKDCDIRRRFFCKHTKSLLSAKEKKQLARERKAVREEVLRLYNGRLEYYWYEPYFSSFKTLKSHFTKNNTSIEIIRKG